MSTSPRLVPLVLLACLVSTGTAQLKRFNGSEDRKLTRVFFYTDKEGFKPQGQVSIDHGVPAWKKSYENEEQFDKTTIGHRWRFGAGMWTRLDTNIELDFGGIRVKPGGYYLLLERPEKEVINLVVVHPAAVRKQKLDAFQADMVKDGILIPMHWTEGHEPAGKLSIELTSDAAQPRDMTMVVRFGPHKLLRKVAAVLP